ncbi:MAG: DUF3857 domain-containing protein [Bacteroidota bacterium]
MNNRTFYFLLLSCLMPLLSVAQQPTKIKYGKIAVEDLSMTSYEKDSQANAVILDDIGYIVVNVRSGFNFRFRHHRRIKILKEAGFDEANISLPYYTGKNAPEKITNLKAQIFLPNGEKYSLGRKEFFEEKIGTNTSIKKFTYPNLEVGAVIEYRYDLLSEHIVNLQDWHFQHELPVRYSELVVEIPNWLDYVYLFNGMQDNAKKKVDQDETVVVEGADEKQEPIEGDARIQIDKNSFVMEHVPAISREPFMTTVDDYRASIRFQLSRIIYPDGRQEDYLTSWEDTAEKLMKNEQFGEQYLKRKNFKEIVAAAGDRLKQGKTESVRAELLGKYLAAAVEWNGKYRMFVSNTLNNAFEKRSASSGEMNLMFLALLRQAGIKAYPMLISTRENGKMIQQYPIVDQFNHVVVVATLDGRKVLFDITDPIRPMGYPSTAALNSYGWLLEDEAPTWIAMESPSGSDTFLADCHLTEDGQLSGRFKGSYTGYNSMPERRHHMKYKDGRHWRNRLGNDVAIDSVSIQNLDIPEKTFKEQFRFKMEDMAMSAGDLLYFQPVFYSNFNEKMFRLEERDFPVDIPYPFKEQFVLKLHIPEGYEVEELPSSTRVLIVNNGGEFNFLCDQKGRDIQLISKIKIRQLKYQPEEYDNIKEFFDKITEKLNEQIVFKKIEG